MREVKTSNSTPHFALQLHATSAAACQGPMRVECSGLSVVLCVDGCLLCCVLVSPCSLASPGVVGFSARNKLLSERPMAAASAQSSAAKKRTKELPLLNPVRSPKRPIKNTDPNKPKPAPIATFSSVFAQDKQSALPVANNSAFFYTNEGFYSKQTSQSQGPLAAVASPAAAIPQSDPVNKSGPPPPISERPKQPEWPLLAASLLRALPPPPPPSSPDRRGDLALPCAPP